MRIFGKKEIAQVIEIFYETDLLLYCKDNCQHVFAFRMFLSVLELFIFLFCFFKGSVLVLAMGCALFAEIGSSDSESRQ